MRIQNPDTQLIELDLNSDSGATYALIDKDNNRIQLEGCTIDVALTGIQTRRNTLYHTPTVENGGLTVDYVNSFISIIFKKSVSKNWSFVEAKLTGTITWTDGGVDTFVSAPVRIARKRNT